MKEMVSEERKKWIKELTEVIDRADSFLKEACEYYQWDIKDLEKVAEENYMVCPFDKSHVVPERSMHRHLESCEWKTLGYTKDCKPLPESTIPEESPFSIKFDMELQFKVLQEAKQKNPDFVIESYDCYLQLGIRLTSDFTRDERKAMYEYVVTHTLAPDLGQDITDMNKPQKKEERSASLLELLVQERNLKRRKTRYRGVHTNKKSHVEIMREVVQQQMEMYKEYLMEKYGISFPDEDQENSRNNVKEEKHSSSKSEITSCNRRSREKSQDSHRSRDHSKNYKENSKYHSNDSHRSHSRDYNDKYRENYKHYTRDYSKSSRHSNQYQDRDYKSYSKDSSRRHDYRDKDENNYHSRDGYEDKNYFHKHSDKSKVGDTKEYRDKSKTSRDSDREYSDWDKGYSKDYYADNQYDSRDRKRDRSSSVDKKYDLKLKDDSSSHNKDKKHENSHKKKKHKSKSHEEKKHKKSKHKHRSRSRSSSRVLQNEK